MSCSRRSCCNDPDSFCYICGEYILKEYKRSITDFVRKVYRAYFGVKLGDQDKPWAPHVVCKSWLSTYECGQKEKLKALDLVCQWCGENRKTTLMIVIFVW